MDLVTRQIVLAARDVVFLKGIIEAHDGLAHVEALPGGEIVIAFPEDRAAEVDALLDDLGTEIKMWIGARP